MPKRIRGSLATALNALLEEGDGLVRAGHSEKAVDRYRAAIALDPRDPRSHYALALQLQSMGKLAEAIEEYRATLDLLPGDLWTLYQLGLAYSALGSVPEARACWEAAAAGGNAYMQRLAETGLLSLAR